MATKKPTPKPTPTKKGLTVVIRKGVTMDPKTGVKTTATPKPKPIKFDKTYDMNSQQYDAYLKKVIRDMKKGK